MADIRNIRILKFSSNKEIWYKNEINKKFKIDLDIESKYYNHYTLVDKQGFPNGKYVLIDDIEILDYKFNCISCNEEVKQISYPFKSSEIWNGNFSDGLVSRVECGYGSKYDGNKYIVTICDDCIKHHSEVTEYLIYNGDYLMDKTIQEHVKMENNIFNDVEYEGFIEYNKIFNIIKPWFIHNIGKPFQVKQSKTKKCNFEIINNEKYNGRLIQNKYFTITKTLKTNKN